jgi:glycosyltransferase involved in cell wall biosynthesis
MPRVSIIMNVRNGAAYLRESLDSVLAQTYSDWELIIWDDRSTDESANIVAEYRDERICYILSPEDTPLGPARDRAIRQAKGEWLAFLDQDDIWLPNKLEKQMALADDEPKPGLIYGRTIVFGGQQRERDFDHRHEFQLLPEGAIFRRLFIDSCFISMSSAVLLRSAVEELGGIPDSIRVIPDYYLFTAVARRYPAVAVQEVVCRYRLHPGSLTNSNASRVQEEIVNLIEMWAPHLDPALVAHRLRVHHTVWAFAEMQHLATFARGVFRLLTRGSVSYFLSRPFARAFRATRRRVQRPCWNAP